MTTQKAIPLKKLQFSDPVTAAQLNLLQSWIKTTIEAQAASIASLSTGASGTLSVSGGGTGATTLAAHGVLLGEGTSAITALVGSTSGQFLKAQGSSSDPVFAAVQAIDGIPVSGSTGGLVATGTDGAVTTMAPAGSSGTVQTQAQSLVRLIGTSRTVSSSSSTPILAYATATGSAGQIHIRLVQRAVTSGTGVSVGDMYAGEFILVYTNVGGTVALSGTQIILIKQDDVGSGAMIAAAAITVAASSATLTFSTTTTAVATVDQQILIEDWVC